MRRGAVRVVGPLQWIIYPALLVLAATLILATPVQLFGLSLPEPVIPMVLAFSWPLIRPSVLAPIALFLTGLFLDLLWGGPKGLWPVCLLAVYGVALASRSFIVGQETRILFAWYAGCTLMASLIGYFIVTLLAGNAPSVIALFLQVLPTILLFPAANMMVQRFDDGDVRFR